MTPKPKPDDKAQSKRFIDTAREVEADDGQTSAADAVMGQLARQVPEPRKPRKVTRMSEQSREMPGLRGTGLEPVKARQPLSRFGKKPNPVPCHHCGGTGKAANASILV